MIEVQQLKQPPIDVASLARAPMREPMVLPAAPGVYLAIDDAIRVWYVGIAESIRDRCANHTRKKDFERKKVTNIAWLAEEAEERRRSVEKDLIEFFHPPLNDQHNNFNSLPTCGLGLTPDQEIERFLRLRVQAKLIELELESLKPNIVTHCEESGGKINHPLGSINCVEYKSWQYSDAVELLKVKLQQAQKDEKQNGKATIKSLKISPVVKLNKEGLSSRARILLERIGEDGDDNVREGES